MAKITQVHAREIFDSRGNPTVEATIVLEDGTTATSSAPSGASKGAYEAVELRDADPARYNGLGVLRAVDNVNTIISKAIVGMESGSQALIDRTMIDLDGTANKEKLGANSILSVSQAVSVAAARSSKLSTYAYLKQLTTNDQPVKLPIPMFNLIEGGKHANNILDFQELLVIPASSKNFSESFEIGEKVYQELKKIIVERGMNPLTADEGGFSPEIGNNRAAVSFLKETIDASGVVFTLDAFIGIDAAASSFYDGKMYKLIDKATEYTSTDLSRFYEELFNDFSLIYIEDPFAETDIDGFKKINSSIGDKTLIVGDDLTVTNPYRLNLAIENKLIGGIIIKPNQIGTVTEAIAVSEIAKFKGLKTIVSHRSGETEDSFIADFAVGVGADYVKFGAPARERILKYDRLLAIEAELVSKSE